MTSLWSDRWSGLRDLPGAAAGAHAAPRGRLEVRHEAVGEPGSGLVASAPVRLMRAGVQAQGCSTSGSPATA